MFEGLFAMIADVHRNLGFVGFVGIFGVYYIFNKKIDFML